MIYFILGGARSGKSKLAEKTALDSGLEMVYLATATAGDEEMHARIERHKRDRDEAFTVIEEPIEIASVIENMAGEVCILVDCLTLWLLNILEDSQRETKIDELLHVLATTQHTVILVSNEVGSGVVPLSPLGRKFVDESGFLHQKIAKVADRVQLVMAGLSVNLKETFA
ncbi:bifunctional adenosylcobinamide kinase/adenosylcobinamide-phosphate guanylyltransferase [Candidatus Thiodubiliella endoseptemdiera]|uniref:Bifunctional adenosylcobalamin biosynthesis protein n=1 Tax=Candidatus Thiodubiliella endoseptemdiera TaxID=2738886 RepID=A0A853EYA5_9GAMM|nr:bifunctional adenosylcobinamide kinase/adenosylcobinamide-phosphate guanylyltransferase [Candidatus Thiodubiliella endoseptemdiera]